MMNTEIKNKELLQSKDNEIKIDQIVYIVTSSNIGTTNLKQILVNWMVNKAVQS